MRLSAGPKKGTGTLTPKSTCPLFFPFFCCRERSRDRSGLVVAVCFDGKTDLNRAMVLRGMALAARKVSTDYVGAERAARSAGRGVWAPEYVEPWHPHDPQKFR
ncbi:MAG: thermonuclease family protein [Alphaproteobacteria bacterium]|nr:thermonuclease family protein [Alphaproteobacteria bacterium]